MHILANKLKNLRISLKGWNRDVFGNIQKNISRADVEVAKAQKNFEENPSPTHREQLHSLQALYLSCLKSEEMFWKQKFRIKWFSDGDANLAYFHSFCKIDIISFIVQKLRIPLVFF